MVAADSRRQRDGRFLEILGHYNPVSQPYELVVHKDKVTAWIAKGAQPSEQVASLLRSLSIPMAAPASAPAAPKPAAAMASAARKRAVKRTVSPRKVRAREARMAARHKVAAKA
jgi:small subunit ribosomal protein S16